MFQGLDVFKAAHAMATHAGQRQAIVARNMANADTPGYKAHDIKPFAEVFRGDASGEMRNSRAGHIGGGEGTADSWQTHRADDLTDPNGNSVSVELELLKGVENKRQHDRALAIYKSSLSILRTSLGRT